MIFLTLAAEASGAVKDVLRDIAQDQPRIATSPLRADGNDWLVWTPAIAGTLALAPRWNGRRSMDDRIAAWIGPVSGVRKSAWKAVSELGSGEVLFPAAVLGYGWGSWREDDRLRRISARWFEALADATIWETGMKLLSGRDRPGTTGSGGRFHGPNGHWSSSFPSGHSTAAFATASVLSQECGSAWVTVPAYTAAAAVAVSRLALADHWTSDVLAGAALGQSIGAWVAHRDRKAPSETARWTPWWADGGLGLAYTRTF